MAMVLLILGLVGAGIYTESVGFYWAAGAVGAIWVLFMMVAAAGVRAIKKQIDKDFDSFGGFGTQNLSPLRVQNRRPTRRP